MKDLITNKITNKKLFESILNLIEKKPIAIFETREVGSKNKIYIVIHKTFFELIFIIDNKYETVRKEYSDIKLLSLQPSKSIGYETKFIIEFKNQINATCLINKVIEAIRISNYLLEQKNDDKDFYKNCVEKSTLDSFEEFKINITGDFKKNKSKKIFSILIMVLGIISAIFLLLIVLI